MEFYFIAHTLLGLVAASPGHIILYTKGPDSAWKYPSWFHDRRVVGSLSLLGLSACVAAIVTTFFEHGLTWGAVTVAEIALGVMISAACTVQIHAFATITSPISISFILGALWKFWYI